MFSLARWSSLIPTGFLVPRRTRVPFRLQPAFRLRGHYPLWRGFPGHFGYTAASPLGRLRSPRTVPQPRICNAATLSHRHGLGCSPFARRYSGNRDFFLFLRVLRCFSSPGSPPTPMNSVQDDQLALDGFPHSEILGSKLVWQLAEAYRSLLRPSSPPGAKASTVRPL